MTNALVITQADRDAAGELWPDLGLDAPAAMDGQAALLLETMAHHFARRRTLSAGEADGWVLVPREPTEAMLKASEREWDGRMSARSSGVWQAMLAAVPPLDDARGDG